MWLETLGHKIGEAIAEPIGNAANWTNDRINDAKRTTVKYINSIDPRVKKWYHQNAPKFIQKAGTSIKKGLQLPTLFDQAKSRVLRESKSINYDAEKFAKKVDELVAYKLNEYKKNEETKDYNEYDALNEVLALLGDAGDWTKRYNRDNTEEFGRPNDLLFFQKNDPYTYIDANGNTLTDYSKYVSKLNYYALPLRKKTYDAVKRMLSKKGDTSYLQSKLYLIDRGIISEFNSKVPLSNHYTTGEKMADTDGVLLYPWSDNKFFNNLNAAGDYANNIGHLLTGIAMLKAPILFPTLYADNMKDWGKSTINNAVDLYKYNNSNEFQKDQILRSRADKNYSEFMKGKDEQDPIFWNPHPKEGLKNNFRDARDFVLMNALFGAVSKYPKILSLPTLYSLTRDSDPTSAKRVAEISNRKGSGTHSW